MNRFAFRSLSLASFLSIVIATTVAEADMTFTTPTGAVAGGQDVDATATFSISAGQIHITLNNLESNPKSDIQTLNGIQFVLSSGLTAGSLASSSAQHVNIAGNGTYSFAGTGSTSWNYHAGVNDGSGSGIELTSIGNTGGGPTLIGSPDSGSDTYSNAGGSIAGSGPHNPFLYETATYTVDITNLLANATISSVYFEFGTIGGTNVAGVPAPTPEPASIAMILVGGGMAAGYVSLRRRRAKMAVATA